MRCLEKKMIDIEYLDDTGTEYLIQKLLSRIHNGTLTLKINNHTLGTFSANQRDDVEVDLRGYFYGYGLDAYGLSPYGGTNFNRGYGISAFGLDKYGE